MKARPHSGKSIRACPFCGSSDLKWDAGGSDYFVWGMGGPSYNLLRCQYCGREVPPILFSSEKARSKFARSKKHAGSLKTGYSAPKYGKILYAIVSLGLLVSAFEALAGREFFLALSFLVLGLLTFTKFAESEPLAPTHPE